MQREQENDRSGGAGVRTAEDLDAVVEREAHARERFSRQPPIANSAKVHRLVPDVLTGLAPRAKLRRHKRDPCCREKRCAPSSASTIRQAAGAVGSHTQTWRALAE